MDYPKMTVEQSIQVLNLISNSNELLDKYRNALEVLQAFKISDIETLEAACESVYRKVAAACVEQGCLDYLAYFIKEYDAKCRVIALMKNIFINLELHDSPNLRDELNKEKLTLAQLRKEHGYCD